MFIWFPRFVHLLFEISDCKNEKNSWNRRSQESVVHHSNNRWRWYCGSHHFRQWTLEGHFPAGIFGTNLGLISSLQRSKPNKDWSETNVTLKWVLYNRFWPLFCHITWKLLLFFFGFGNPKEQYIRPKVTVHTCAETMWGNTVCFFLDPCHLWFCHYSFLLLSLYRLGCCQKTGTYKFYGKKICHIFPLYLSLL